MTIKEQINGLLETARRPDTLASERADLVEQARRLCREHKIGMAAFDWPSPSEPGGVAEDPEGGPSVAGLATPGPRSIGEMVEQLLMDPSLNYVDIAGRVRAHFPHARTTNRSVASVAKAMRAKGVDIARRRVLRTTEANKE